jgi:polysaccharide biosynthesis/export protein
VKKTRFIAGFLTIVAVAGFARERQPSGAAIPGSKDAEALFAMATDMSSTPKSPSGPATDQNPAVREFQDRYPRYELRPSDVITISFAFTPDLNQSVTVQPDGFIALAQVGELHAASQTIPHLRQMITDAYAGILRDPVINVELKEFEKLYLTVFGQVHSPGKLDLRGATTVVGAIGAAGGFTGDAKHSQVVLFRRVSSQWIRVRVINVKQMLNSGDLAEDAQVQPGDLIYVPKNALSKVRPWIPYYGFGLSFTSSASNGW